MKLIRWSMALLVAVALVGGVALAQYQPNQPKQPTTVKGETHAPTDTNNQTAENRQTIPAPAEAHAAPPELDDAGLAEAARKTPLGLVRLTMDKGKPTLGVLLVGADKEHWFVVTNFLPIAGAKWVEAQTNDNAKLEVEGLANYNETQDLALLQVKAPESKKAPEIKKPKLKGAAVSAEEAAPAQVFDLKKPHPLDLAEKNPSEGELVYAIGLPEANRPTAGWADFGKVQKVVSGSDIGAAADSQWLQTDPVISQNNRGGALVDHDGKVVGLLTFAGRTDKGPALSVPVSVIRALLDRPGLDVAATYPNPKGSFVWPASRGAAKAETFPPSRAISTADAVKDRLKCPTCTGHGYVVTSQVTINQGKTIPGADIQTSCDACGGTGILIQPDIHRLLAGLTRVVLNPDPKAAEAEILRAKTSVQDACDRAAVNRLVLANTLDGTAGKLLGEPDANRGEAVVFIAELGPKVKWKEGKDTQGKDIQWVLAYGSNIWAIAYGAEPRGNRSLSAGVRAAAPTAPFGGRHAAPAAPPVVASGSRYVLVSGIIEGVTLLETGKSIYRAPLIRVADIDSLRN